MASFVTCDKDTKERVLGNHGVEMMLTSEGKNKIHTSITNQLRYQRRISKESERKTKYCH